jgi:hypothetical protein
MRMRAVYLIASALWGIFAVAVLCFLFAYLSGGAGLQFLGFQLSSVSVLLGVGHFIGIVTGFLVCLAMSAGLLVMGTVRE